MLAIGQDHMHKYIKETGLQKVNWEVIGLKLSLQAFAYLDEKSSSLFLHLNLE